MHTFLYQRLDSRNISFCCKVMQSTSVHLLFVIVQCRCCYCFNEPQLYFDVCVFATCVCCWWHREVEWSQYNNRVRCRGLPTVLPKTWGCCARCVRNKMMCEDISTSPVSHVVPVTVSHSSFSILSRFLILSSLAVLLFYWLSSCEFLLFFYCTYFSLCYILLLFGSL